MKANVIHYNSPSKDKLDSAVNHALSDCNECLKDNLTFKNHLREFISTGMDHREAIARALYFTIVTINKNVDNLRDLNTSLILEKDELAEQVEEEQTWRKDAEQTCDRMSHYIVKLERENEELKNELEEAQGKLESLRKENKGWESYIKELKEQNESYKIDSDNLFEATKNLTKRNDALENEISGIRALFNEKVDTIIKRDNEIDALKHMLDREEW